MRKAGIIGGMDFLGCYITLKFLSEDFLVKSLVPRFQKYHNLVINISLKSHNNLEICKNNPDDLHQMRNFINDCEIIIHCGTPVKLGNQPNGNPLFIPVIQNAGTLLKAMRDNLSVSKVIFIASAAALNSTSESDSISGEVAENGMKKSKLANPHYRQAKFHAEKALQTMPDSRIEIVIVPPVELNGNVLTNSRETTIAGLRYIFANSIKHDPVFLKILQKKALHIVENTEVLPDWIFNSLVPQIPSDQLFTVS